MDPQFKTFAEIHEALKAGKRVFWANDNYEVTRKPHYGMLLKYNIDPQDNYVLDCRCIENYFGGLLGESEISRCFTKIESAS